MANLPHFPLRFHLSYLVKRHRFHATHDGNWLILQVVDGGFVGLIALQCHGHAVISVPNRGHRNATLIVSCGHSQLNQRVVHAQTIGLLLVELDVGSEQRFVHIVAH